MFPEQCLLALIQRIQTDKDETISIYDYLTYAISKNWIDIKKLNVDGQYFVRYQAIARNTLNTSLLKKDLPELYKAYMKVVNSTRFTITAA